MEDKSTRGLGAPAPLRYRAGDANQKPRVAGLRAKKKPITKKRTAEQTSATEHPPPKKRADASSVAIAPTATRTGSTKASESGKKPVTASTATSTASSIIALESDLSDNEDQEEEIASVLSELDASADAVKRRASYTTKQDCLVLQEVLGDGGLFDRKGEAKTERWVSITTRMSTVLKRQISPEGLRKHIEVLVKKYRKQMTKERGLSGREPKKTADQVELEGLLIRYIEFKEDEDSKKVERNDNRKQKAEEDRVAGEAIREAALSCEKPKKQKKSSGNKRSDPLEFLKALTQTYEARRASEARERLELEERMQQRAAELHEKQLQSQQESSRVMAVALQALAKVLGAKDADSDTSTTSSSN